MCVHILLCLSPENCIMICLPHAVDPGKVHQGVGRLIKIYVAYLKTLPRCVVMLSAEVSEGRGVEGGREGSAGNTVGEKKEVEGYVWNVRFLLLIN